MKNWIEMSAGDFHAHGAQLDMLAGIEGDGYGTLNLLDAVAAAEAETVEDNTGGKLFDILPGILGEPDTILQVA